MACHGYANGCRCAACEHRSDNFPERISPNKDVREEVRTLRKLGFSYAGIDGRGHHCFEHEIHGEITVAGTPSSRSWRKRHRHRLARLMGLSRWQLERMLTGQPLESSERENGPGRKPNEVVVMETAMELGIPCSHTQARRLISRFDGVRGARRALGGMRRAAERRLTCSPISQPPVAREGRCASKHLELEAVA